MCFREFFFRLFVVVVVVVVFCSIFFYFRWRLCYPTHLDLSLILLYLSLIIH